MSGLKSYAVWDASTRWFHWINALSVISLAGIGLVILNDAALGMSKPDKVVLKTLHVWLGYAVAINLVFRRFCAWVGNSYARWPQLLPCGSGYFGRLGRYASSVVNGWPEHYLGHNPMGRGSW